MLINRANLDFLFNNWNARYQTAYAAQQNWWDLYATLMPSNSAQNVYSWIAQQTGLREWIGARQVDNAVARDYSLANKDFEKTVGLDRNKVEDDTYNVFGPVVDDLAVQSKLWPDDVMTPVVEAGNATVCHDGQFFFDTDHPVDLDDATKGTYSTNLVGATYDLATDPIGAWKAAKANGGQIKGESGRPLGIIYDTLMVPVSLEEPALRIANAQLTAQAIKEAGANVAAAAVDNVWKGSITVIVNPRLSDQAVGYALVTKRPIKPFLWQLRKSPELVVRNSPSDPSVFDAKTFLYGVDARGAGGYTLPFLAARLAPS
jgi:phage major head subunit gpT-like protein